MTGVGVRVERRPAEEMPVALRRDVRLLGRLLGQVLEEAERVAAEAVELAADTDMLGMQAGALLDLARVRRLVGREAEVAPLARQALALAERKGHRVAAAQARDLTTAQPGGVAAP